MANGPSSDTVYNTVAAMQTRGDTPGMNQFVFAWSALQDLTGPWAVQTYNRAVNVHNLMDGLQR